jgi:hypothetical protein
MESVALGTPLVPRGNPADLFPVRGTVEGGLTFEDNGLRARLSLGPAAATAP